jgi:arylsulfatase A-like enzyme
MIPIAAGLLLIASSAWARTRPASAAKPLNVLIIGADTLRADHLDLYGYSRPTSPNLDRIAAQGAVFEEAFGQGSYTLPSFASFFTSLYPEQHGATNRRTRIKDSATTLAEIFQRRGYRTAGFTGGPNVALPYGFGRGYDSYLSGDLPRQLDAYIPVALDWIEKDSSKPFFLFLQPQDVHPPFDLLDLPKAERDRWDPGYDGPAERYMGSFYYYRAFSGEPYDGYGPVPSEAMKKEMDAARKDPRVLRHMASVYDDRVAHFDRSFGAFWKELERRGLLDNTVVVLMSDHGTLFGEGGNFAHGNHLSTLDAVFHVALVVWAPGRKPARVRSLVELVDAAPTILELAGLPAPAQFEGRSLVPLMDGGKRSGAVFGTASSAGNDAKLRRFARDERWKLSVGDPDSKIVLYDLASDPAEEKDVSAANPDVVKRLSGELALHLQRVGRPQ